MVLFTGRDKKKRRWGKAKEIFTSVLLFPLSLFSFRFPFFFWERKREKWWKKRKSREKTFIDGSKSTFFSRTFPNFIHFFFFRSKSFFPPPSLPSFIHPHFHKFSPQEIWRERRKRRGRKQWLSSSKLGLKSFLPL